MALDAQANFGYLLPIILVRFFKEFLSARSLELEIKIVWLRDEERLVLLAVAVDVSAGRP